MKTTFKGMMTKNYDDLKNEVKMTPKMKKDIMDEDDLKKEDNLHNECIHMVLEVFTFAIFLFIPPL